MGMTTDIRAETAFFAGGLGDGTSPDGGCGGRSPPASAPYGALEPGARGAEPARMIAYRGEREGRSPLASAPYGALEPGARGAEPARMIAYRGEREGRSPLA
jgi:hypothetical protein